MPHVNHIVLKRFIGDYLEANKNKSTLGKVGDQISTLLGDNNSTEITKLLAKLETLLNKLKKDNNAIADLLITLGNLGRIAQINRTQERLGITSNWLAKQILGTTPSKLSQTCYAAISYILMTIATYPADNADYARIIAIRIKNLENFLTAKKGSFDINTEVKKQLDDINSLACDLASLGCKKWIVISQKIPDLYGSVEFPQSATTTALANTFTAPPENIINENLPWILHLDYVIRYLENDYSHKTTLKNFIDKALEKHRLETGEEVVNTSNNNSPVDEEKSNSPKSSTLPKYNNITLENCTSPHSLVSPLSSTLILNGLNKDADGNQVAHSENVEYSRQKLVSLAIKPTEDELSTPIMNGASVGQPITNILAITNEEYANSTRSPVSPTNSHRPGSRAS